MLLPLSLSMDEGDLDYRGGGDGGGGPVAAAAVAAAAVVAAVAPGGLGTKAAGSESVDGHMMACRDNS